MSFESILERLLRRRPQSEPCEVLHIVDLEVVDHRTALICEGASGLSTLLVPRTPSGEEAARWRHVMRIDRVEIEVRGGDVTAVLIGASHRIPSRRQVSVSVALSLIDSGSVARAVVYERGSDSSND